jgi:hypothetical protein
VSGGWNKKTQAAGIGARAGSGDAMEVAVRDHGGAAAAMAAGIGEDRLAQIEQVEWTGCVAGGELHGAKPNITGNSAFEALSPVGGLNKTQPSVFTLRTWTGKPLFNAGLNNRIRNVEHRAAGLTPCSGQADAVSAR